jgi:hypothetical protein
VNINRGNPVNHFVLRAPALSLVLATVVSLALSFAPALAVTHEAHLDGLQEVPPVATPATGYAKITVDTQANTMRVVLTFQDLIGSQTAAHLHGPAAPGINAGVLVGFPLGNFDQTFPITDVIEGHILAGLTYVNVHSTFRPGGEIRGQVGPQPPTAVEETSWAGVKNLYR